MQTETVKPSNTSTQSLVKLTIQAMESGLLPDVLVRAGIRKLCSDRLEELRGETLELEQEAMEKYLAALKSGPLAIETQAANEQHYEVPYEFFRKVLGARLKYSSAYFPPGCESLDEAEEHALRISCQRAKLESAQEILELGCGWGSLSLYMAEHFPHARITAVSNSNSQREWIESQAKERGFKNLRILTRNLAEVADLRSLLPEGATGFDRVVTIEMMEHFKNYEILLERISKALLPRGFLFVHIFTHKTYAYPFETEGEDNWMGKYFFTGGQMPSHMLLSRFQKHLSLQNQWHWDGVHYEKTSNAWLQNLDLHREEAEKSLVKLYGPKEAKLWVQRWRIFFMACAELFGYQSGREWGVSHYRFIKGDPS
jgi:cyclopropane-fatty-acyl-phospholipid synthase